MGCSFVTRLLSPKDLGVIWGRAERFQPSEVSAPSFPGMRTRSAARNEGGHQARTERLIRPMKMTAMKIRCAMNGLLLAAHQSGHVVGV